MPRKVFAFSFASGGGSHHFFLRPQASTDLLLKYIPNEGPRPARHAMRALPSSPGNVANKLSAGMKVEKRYSSQYVHARRQ